LQFYFGIFLSKVSILPFICLILQSYKTVVTDNFRKQVVHVSANRLIIIVFEGSMVAQVKADHDSDHLRIGELSAPVAVFSIPLKLAAFNFSDLCGKFFAKIVHITENFRNFVLVIHK